jgi:pyruvyltransferase
MIRLYRWPEANFGDQLSLLVCRSLADDPVEPVGDPTASNLVAIGSILEQLHDTTFDGAVWGTGMISDGFGKIRIPNARFAAVRGRFTRDLVGAPKATPLGDPGLLVDRIAPPCRPRHEVGIVAHRVDRNDPDVQAVADRSPAIIVIDVTTGPETVLEQIASCRVIVSSALHGLVAADALGLPSAWIRLSDRVIGDGFKFRDYYSAFGLDEPEPVPFGADDDVASLIGKTRRIDPTRIGAVKRSLESSFPYRSAGAAR